MTLSKTSHAFSFTHHNCQMELTNIAQWWVKNSVDNKYGGFFGENNFFGVPVEQADKSIILNSRILWFFSELSQFNPDSQYTNMANRAFSYLLENFDDIEYGGVYWRLDYKGKMLDGKKQIYAQCFSIYALVAYYRLTGNCTALNKALEYFDFIERYAKDDTYGGYTECFSQQWTPTTDFRLSEKDINLPKSMNTHLHVLEAYTALYQAVPSKKIQFALKHAIDIFEEKIIDSNTNHLKLFFDNSWNNHSKTYSYGHDIEASWLIWESLEALGDKNKLNDLKSTICSMAHTCLTMGTGNWGQICDEYCLLKKTRSEHSIWWVQAEALVGFLNAYSITGDNAYINACNGIWDYINQYHLDKNEGEWHWYSSLDHDEQAPVYKAGFWKAPYHNGRAMIEICKRFEKLY